MFSSRSEAMTLTRTLRLPAQKDLHSFTFLPKILKISSFLLNSAEICRNVKVIPTLYSNGSKSDVLSHENTLCVVSRVVHGTRAPPVNVGSDPYEHGRTIKSPFLNFCSVWISSTWMPDVLKSKCQFWNREKRLPKVGGVRAIFISKVQKREFCQSPRGFRTM